MYQLIQISFQNFFSILCTNPNTYLASIFFSVFYVPTVLHPLLTSIPPRPARIRTTTQTHNTNPHTHHHTPADTFPRPPPPCRTSNHTTVPLHRTPKHITAPHSQTYDLLTTQLHDPDTRTLDRRSIAAAPDATGARVAAGPRRRWRRRWRDAGLIPSPRLRYPLAVPVYSARLLAGL